MLAGSESFPNVYEVLHLSSAWSLVWDDWLPNTLVHHTPLVTLFTSHAGASLVNALLTLQRQLRWYALRERFASLSVSSLLPVIPIIILLFFFFFFVGRGLVVFNQLHKQNPEFKGRKTHLESSLDI